MNFFTAEILLSVNASKLAQQLKRAETASTKTAKQIETAWNNSTAKRMNAETRAASHHNRLEQQKKRAAERSIKAMQRDAEKSAKAMQRASEKSAKAAARAHKQAVARIKKAYQSLVRVVKWATLAMAAALTVVSKAAMKQEDALFLLDAALKISGEHTEELSTQFRKFAAEMQRTTIYGDEFVLSLMQQQKSLGVVADKLEDGAKMAIGLATATGQGIESMSRYVALAYQGAFTMLRRYIPALRATTDATEQLAIVQKFAADGFKLAQKRAQTTSGALRQMWNALGDVTEILGKPLLDIIEKSAKKIKKWAEDNQKEIGAWAIDTVENIKSVVSALGELITAYGKFARAREKAFRTWGKTVMEFGGEYYAAHIQGLDTFWSLVLGKQKNANKEQKEEYLKALREREAAYKQSQTEIEKLYAAGLAYPVGHPLGQPIPKVVRFDDSVTGVYNKQAEAEEKAIHRLQTMTASAKGLSEELQRKRDIMEYTALATIAYGDNLEGATASVERFKEALKAKDMMKEATEAASSHIDWLREQENMSLDQKIENITTEMDYLREKYGYQMEAEALLAAERKRYTDENIQGLAATGKAIEAWAKRAGNWGKKLGDILTNAFDRTADSLAEMAMQGKVDFRSLARSIIKDLMAMIIKLQMARALMSFFPNLAPAPIPVYNVPAPSLDSGGLVTKTGLAKVDKGEVFSGVKNEMGFGENITINNYASDTVEVDTYRDSDQRIIDVSLRAAAGNGTYRRAHKIG